MDNDNKIQSRKKFIGASLSAAGLLASFKFFSFRKKKKANTVKMLTQEGKLVEVNISALPSKKRKITNKELQNWIKKDKV